MTATPSGPVAVVKSVRRWSLRQPAGARGVGAGCGYRHVDGFAVVGDGVEGVRDGPDAVLAFDDHAGGIGGHQSFGPADRVGVMDAFDAVSTEAARLAGDADVVGDAHAAQGRGVDEARGHHLVFVVVDEFGGFGRHGEGHADVVPDDLGIAVQGRVGQEIDHLLVDGERIGRDAVRRGGRWSGQGTAHLMPPVSAAGLVVSWHSVRGTTGLASPTLRQGRGTARQSCRFDGQINRRVPRLRMVGATSRVPPRQPVP